MNKIDVIKEVVIKAPLPAVWKAITEKEEMKNWYFELDDFIPKAGFEFSFYGEKDGRKFLHLCKIIEVIKNRKISYSWKYEGFPGESIVTFELAEQNGNTIVKLTHSGLDTFPADNPDFARENFIEGWNYLIGTSLKEYTEEKNRG